MESDNDDVHINDMCSSILKTIKYLLDIPELSTESQYIKSNEFSIKLYNLHSQVNFLYAIMRKCNFSWDIIHNDHNHILNVNQNTKMQHISNNINKHQEAWIRSRNVSLSLQRPSQSAPPTRNGRSRDDRRALRGCLTRELSPR